MNEIIINFTPTGMLPTRRDTPEVPLKPHEIVADVRMAYELGITMVHVHARDADSEKPTWQKSVYAEIIAGIRAFAPDLVICVSTSGRLYNTLDKRSEVLSLDGDLKPDMASLTLSSLNFNHQVSMNEPEMILALADIMNQRKIKPELEIFDLGMVNYLHYLIRKQIIAPPFYANLILGNIASAQSDLAHIGLIIKDLPANTLFSLGGVGNFQLQTNALAVAMGYGVRVGLEDNTWYNPERTRLATNQMLLERLQRIIQANECTVMKPAGLRQRLQLQPGHGQWGS